MGLIYLVYGFLRTYMLRDNKNFSFLLVLLIFNVPSNIFAVSVNSSDLDKDDPSLYKLVAYHPF